MSSCVSVHVTKLEESRFLHSVDIHNEILIGRANSVSSIGVDPKLWT